MRNKTIKKVAYILAASVQLMLIGSVVVLNMLTSKKAGVMHHVYYRRYQYEQSIFSNDNLLLQSILAVVLGVLFTALLIRAVKKKKSTFYKTQIALAAGLGFMISFVINSDFFISMLAYPYFIMVFEFVSVIQILALITTIFLEKRIIKG